MTSRALLASHSSSRSSASGPCCSLRDVGSSPSAGSRGSPLPPPWRSRRADQDDAIAAVALLGLIVFVPPAFRQAPHRSAQVIACTVTAAYFGLRMAQDSGGPGALGLLFLLAAPVVLCAIAVAHIRHVLQERVPL